MALSGWAADQKIAAYIDNTKIDSALSDFPVMLKMSEACGTSSYDASEIFDLLKDTEDSNTKVLLNFNGDRGDSRHLITVNGNPVLYPPETISGLDVLGSMYFDGTGDMIYMPDNDDFDMGSGNFTFDMWVKFDSVSGNDHFFNRWLVAGGDWYLVRFGTEIRFGDSVWGTITTSGLGLSTDTWYHIALVRNGNTVTIYVDGVDEANDTVSGSLQYTDTANRRLTIGRIYDSDTDSHAGYVTEVRISKGTARWTTGFSTPTTRHKLDEYTVFLYHFNGDRGNTGHNFTLNGTPLLEPEVKKAPGLVGGIHLDGASEYLSAPDHADWDWGTGDFTMDCWFRLDSIPGVGRYSCRGDVGATNGCWAWGIGTTWGGGTKFNFADREGGGVTDHLSNALTVSTDTWYHAAIVRESGTITFYLDGVASGTSSCAHTLDAAELFYIGIRISGGPSEYFPGYIEEFRLSKGVARWSSGFTPNPGPYISSYNNRKKIAVTNDSDTELYVEIEKWDHDNEEIILHTKVGTIASGADTLLYIYYDENHADNTTYIGDIGESAGQSVWDSNFVGVWHLGELDSGAAGTKDSTSGGKDLYKGTDIISERLTQAGYGTEFIANAADVENMLNRTDENDFDLTALTMEILVKKLSVITDDCLSAKGANGSWNYNWNMGFDGSDKFRIGYYDGSWHWATGSTTIVVDTEYHFAGTIDTADLEVFLNGVTNGNTAYSGTPPNTTAAFTIGGQYHWTSTWFNPATGIYAEARLSKIVRPDEWIKATSNSLQDTLIEFDDPATIMEALAGAFTMTGYAVTTAKGVAIIAEAGSYTLTGSDINTIYDPLALLMAAALETEQEHNSLLETEKTMDSLIQTEITLNSKM